MKKIRKALIFFNVFTLLFLITSGFSLSAQTNPEQSLFKISDESIVFIFGLERTETLKFLKEFITCFEHYAELLIFYFAGAMDSQSIGLSSLKNIFFITLSALAP